MKSIRIAAFLLTLGIGVALALAQGTPKPPEKVPPKPAEKLPAPLLDGKGYTVHRFETTCNTYFLTCKETKEFVVIDPGYGILPKIKAHIASGHSYVGVWITHEHGDHVSGLDQATRGFTVAVVAHVIAAKNIKKLRRNWKNWEFPEDCAAPPEPNTIVDGGVAMRVGKLALSSYHLPGHSPGSLAFQYRHRFIFTGDVLFKGSVGRTDLSSSDAVRFARSLSVLWDLPEMAVVLPGHGEQTTLGEEQKTNWLFEDAVREARGEEPIPRPWIGIRMATGRKEPGLLLEEVVPGSPAEKAGLKAGDVITKVADTEIRTPEDLRKVVATRKPGDEVKLRVIRGGKPLDLALELGKRPRPETPR